MSEISLRTAKSKIEEKRGYTGTHGHSSLDNLRALVNNMLAVRRAPMVGSGPTANIYGSRCTGHTTKMNFDSHDLSIGGLLDFEEAYIKPCMCDADYEVKCECQSAINCLCQSRTTCGCVSRDGCGCNYDTCTCNSDYCPSNCTCQSTTACNCQSRGCSCVSRNVGQNGEWDVTPCACENACDCVTDGGGCTGNDPYREEYGCPWNCDCENKKDSTGVTVDNQCPSNVSCTCDTRCSCNAVKIFY